VLGVGPVSFYTTLHFYRPTPPPRVTGPSLARFVADLMETGCFERTHDDSFSVKFGRAIDQDEKGTSLELPVPGLPGVLNIRDIEWDIKQHQIAMADALRLLRAEDRPIYRSFISLGTAPQSVREALSTPRPDGERNLGLWDGFLSIEPIDLSQMSSDAPFRVGWMSVGYGGSGYLHPWTARDLTDRAATLAALSPLTVVCRKHFPVDPVYRGGGFRRGILPGVFSRRAYIRRRMGELWPFDRLDVPWDWYWGVHETG
jgi:hypothetical protein